MNGGGVPEKNGGPSQEEKKVGQWKMKEIKNKQNGEITALI